MYHSVAPQESDFTRGLGVTVRPSTFARQLDYLTRHYQVVSLQDMVVQLQHGRLEDRCVAITFDDGFRDNYRFALPLLRERGLPATVFVVADVLDNAAVLWMHRLAYLANTCGVEKVLHAARSALPAASPDIADFHEAWPRFKEEITCGLEAQERDRLLNTMCDALGVYPDRAPEADHLYLRSADIGEMRMHGVDFGAHGATHTALSAMSTDQQKEELRRGWEAVVAWADGSPPPLAYPFGEPRHYTPSSRSLAQEAGHCCIVTVGDSWVTAESDPASLDRIKAEEEPLEAFAARLEGVSLRSWLTGLKR